MNNLQIFNNSEFGQVRMILVDDKPYAVGNDIASSLGYKRPYEAVKAHCKGAVIHRVIDSMGREQNTKVIPEGDIYRLIVKAADQSQNNEIKRIAEKFESWIFDDVLPQIRKTGGYNLPKTLPDALRAYADQVEQNQKLIAENNEMKPKVEKYNRFMNADGLISVSDTAKLTGVKGIGQNKLFKIMRDELVFYKRNGKNSVYQEYINRGYFEVKEIPFNMGGEDQVYQKIYFTPKGVDWLSGFLKLRGYEEVNQ